MEKFKQKELYTIRVYGQTQRFWKKQENGKFDRTRQIIMTVEIPRSQIDQERFESLVHAVNAMVCSLLQDGEELKWRTFEYNAHIFIKDAHQEEPSNIIVPLLHPEDLPDDLPF